MTFLAGLGVVGRGTDEETLGTVLIGHSALLPTSLPRCGWSLGNHPLTLSTLSTLSRELPLFNNISCVFGNSCVDTQVSDSQGQRLCCRMSLPSTLCAIRQKHRLPNIGQRSVFKIKKTRFKTLLRYDRYFPRVSSASLLYRKHIPRSTTSDFLIVFGIHIS